MFYPAQKRRFERFVEPVQQLAEISSKPTH
ncbi:hypothetical protein ALON55S_05235 [Alishewanella longhuensis]